MDRKNRTRLLAIILGSSVLMHAVEAKESNHYINLLKEMFNKVTIDKNAEMIPKYYDPEFELSSNGETMDFKQFLEMHKNVYKTSIQYQIRYDEETFIEQGNKIAGRAFITTKSKDQPAHEIEVMLVAEYKADKLYRLWELTYPDWTKLKSFQDNAK